MDFCACKSMQIAHNVIKIQNLFKYPQSFRQILNRQHNFSALFQQRKCDFDAAISGIPSNKIVILIKSCMYFVRKAICYCSWRTYVFFRELCCIFFVVLCCFNSKNWSVGVRTKYSLFYFVFKYNGMRL